MTRAPSHLVTELQTAVRAERDARAAFVAAKTAHQGAMARTAGAAAELRAAGFPMTSIARVFARGMGLAANVAIRKRIAALLRKRTARTAGHAELLPPSAPASAAPIPWDATSHGGTANETESDMSRLVKRVTTTEEYVEEEAPKKKQAIRGTTTAPDEELEDGDEFADVGDEEDDEQPRAARRRK